jgi:hypothetical protein
MKTMKFEIEVWTTSDDAQSVQSKIEKILRDGLHETTSISPARPLGEIEGSKWLERCRETLRSITYSKEEMPPSEQLKSLRLAMEDLLAHCRGELESSVRPAEELKKRVLKSELRPGDTCPACKRGLLYGNWPSKKSDLLTCGHGRNNPGCGAVWWQTGEIKEEAVSVKPTQVEALAAVSNLAEVVRSKTEKLAAETKINSRLCDHLARIDKVSLAVSRPGKGHYCKRHQGDASHYDSTNCDICRLHKVISPSAPLPEREEENEVTRFLKAHKDHDLYSSERLITCRTCGNCIDYEPLDLIPLITKGK